MLSRNIIRVIAPATYRYCTLATVSHDVKQTILASRFLSPRPKSSGILASRFYSQEANTKSFLSPRPKSSEILASRFYSQEANTKSLPVVDFDYVKKATLQNEVMIIDVREPDEIKEHGKIPNSLNIPLGSIDTTLAMSERDFQKAYNRTKPKENTEIIFYCMIGKRSGKAQHSAVNLGFKNTKNYLGSWTDWAIKNQ